MFDFLRLTCFIANDTKLNTSIKHFFISYCMQHKQWISYNFKSFRLIIISLYCSHISYFSCHLIATNLFQFQVCISMGNYTTGEIIILGFFGGSYLWLFRGQMHRYHYHFLLLNYYYKTNRFHVDMHLFSKWPQKMSKWGKTLNLPCLGITCNQLLNRHTAAWVDNR